MASMILVQVGPIFFMVQIILIYYLDFLFIDRMVYSNKQIAISFISAMSDNYKSIHEYDVLVISPNASMQLFFYFHFVK
jgi:hypothetical protein